MYPYLGIAFAFVAVAVIVGLSVLGHHLFTANVYAAPFGAEGFVDQVAATANGFPIGDGTAGSAATLAAAKQRALILDHIRDGADWAKSLHAEVTFWAVAILVVLVLVLGATFLAGLWGRVLF